MYKTIAARRPGALLAVCLVFLSPGFALRADLIHHWAFDEEEGLVASDRASCAGSGELVGFDLNDDSQWDDGEFEGGLALGRDGVLDDRVIVGLEGVSAAATGGFTVCLWVNPGDAILNLGEYQLLRTPGDAVGFTIMNFDDGVNRHDRVLLFWDGDINTLHVGTTTLEPGEWYHVAITSTGIGGEKLYYVNGELEEAVLLLPERGGVPGDHFGTRDGWAAGPGALGALETGARAHNSTLDDFRIYDTALTPEEILDVLETPVARAPTIRDVEPLDGTFDHEAADGLAFEAVANAPGATIPIDGIRLLLNSADVTAGLVVSGTETTRGVLFSGLDPETAYDAVIEVTDSAGGRACFSFSFGTLTGQVEGLVHHWTMDHTSGLTALDTGSARNGRLMGFNANDDSQWVRGICDQGLDLGANDSVGKYVEANLRAINAFDTGGFTVAMWLNPGEAILQPGEFQLLSTPGDVVGFTIMNTTRDGILHERVLLFWDGVLADLHVGTTTLEPGTWYHVAITSSGFGGEKLYYVNGELEEQRLFSPAQGGTEGFHPANRDGWAEGVGRIGAINLGDRSHDSIIDDVRIYDRPLEEDELFEVLEECDPVICGSLALESVSVSEGDAFHAAASGLVFEVSSPNGGAGFGIDAEDVLLLVNGEAVAPELGGTPARRTITYSALAANQFYDVRLEVTDGCADLVRSVLFGTFSSCDEDDGLVHRFRLDESDGDRALDCVGGAIGRLVNFTDDGSRWIEAIDGGGLDFGSDDRIDNALEFTTPALDALASGGYSIAMWIRPGAQILTPAEYQLFVAPGGGVGLTIMTRTNEGFLHDRVLLFWDSSLPNLHVGTTALEPDRWVHVAVTSTGPGGVKEYYVDGVLEEKARWIPSQLGEDIATAGGWPAGSARIGANFGLQTRYHDSAYDDVRIYERALSETEVAELADAEPPSGGFHRGDADDDGALRITDGIYILNYLFNGGETPSCLEAANADGNDTLNLTDALNIFGFLFLGGPPPAAPGPPPAACGPDPDGSRLGCVAYSSCG